MKVEAIDLVGLTTHKMTVMKLPPRGIVLITGPNGAGKSTFVEAVAMGGWGETLRGKPPWNAPDSTAQIGITTSDGLHIERHRTKTKTKLTFALGQAEPVKYENATKAQAALEEAIGSFDIWRRTCVFSSQDAAHFSIATDGERKRLLETILGLNRFDPAGEKCRKDLALARKKVEAATWEKQLQQSSLEGNAARLADARTALTHAAVSGNVDELEAKYAELTTKAREKKEEHTKVGDARDTMTDARSAIAQKIIRLDEQDELLKKSHCATCEQEINGRFADGARQANDKQRSKLNAEFAEIERSRESLTQLRVHLSNELSTIEQERGDVRARLSQAKEQKSNREELEALIEKLQRAVDTAHEDIADILVSLEMVQDEVAELEVAEKVLGLNGVRAHLLHNALGGIEEIANTWLKRLTGKDLELVLSPYSEKATGGIKDAISLEVRGAGGGHGYKASSGGERRRLDIALLLALGEVAEAAHGQSGSTMWFDEVFDALDEDGVDAVCDVLNDIAMQRCVVLITHNEHIKQRLRNLSYGIHVENGKVETR